MSIFGYQARSKDGRNSAGTRGNREEGRENAKPQRRMKVALFYRGLESHVEKAANIKISGSIAIMLHYNSISLLLMVKIKRVPTNSR
jgi:hypothetical protein